MDRKTGAVGLTSSAGRYGGTYGHLESLNSVLIRQGLAQSERLRTLNEIAISQMRTLLSASSVERLR